MINSIGHDYLTSRSLVYNGGFLGRMLSQTTIVNTPNKFFVETGKFEVGDYIKTYFFNDSKPIPNFLSGSDVIIKYDSVYNTNVVTTGFGLTYITLSILLCLFLIIFWICYQENKYNPKLQIFQRKMEKFIFPHKKRSSFSSDTISILSRETFHNNRMHILNRNFILSALCCTLSIAYFILFILSAFSHSCLQNQLVSNNNNNSLILSWQQTTQNINSFFNIILEDSYQMFNKTIDLVTNSIQNLLTSSLNNLTTRLMSLLGVSHLFTILYDLLLNLNFTVISMEYISQNSANIISIINQLKGRFSVYQDQLQIEMNSVCSNLIDKKKCLEYLDGVSLLKVPINTNNINTESSVNMIFVLNQFRLNLTQLTKQVNDIQEVFNAKIRQLTDSKVKELNIAQSLNDVRKAWNSIPLIFGPAKSEFNKTSKIVSTYILDGSSIFLIISILILVFIFLITCSYFILTLRYSMLYYFERLILRETLNTNSSEPLFCLHNIKKIKLINILQNKYHPPNWAIYTFLLMFGVIVIVLIIISLSTTSVSELIYSEICTQLWDVTGLKNTDKMINSFFNSQWNSIMEFIASKKSDIQINLTKPSNILQSIQQNCTNGTGLLNVLKWTNLVNISSFLWSPQNLKVLYSGVNLTYQTIIDIDTTNIMPPDLKMFFDMANNITKYFDGIDYTKSILELSKGAIEMQNLSQWINGSLNYFSSIADQQSTLTVKHLTMVQSDIKSISDLQNNIDIFKNHYIQIQERRVNNLYINQLFKDLNLIQSNFKPSRSTYDIVDHTYRSIMLTNFTMSAEILLNQYLKEFLTYLFPCQDLSKTFSLILNNFCNNNQLLETLASYGLILSIMSVVLIFMYYVLWILIIMEFSENTEINISKC